MKFSITPKPWVKKAFKVIPVFVLFALIVYVVFMYFKGMDQRIDALEKRPTLQVIKTVSPTATPSAIPTVKKVQLRVVTATPAN